MRQLACALGAIAVCAAPFARADGDDESPAQDARLETAFGKLRSPDGATRLKAASELSSLPPEAESALVRRLARPRTTTAETYRTLVLEMWGQVPNWKSADPMWIKKPEPVWTPPPLVKGQKRPRRPAPHDPEKVEWLEALSGLDLNAPELAQLPNKEEARAEAMEAVALMRSIARARRPSGVDAIFKLAFEYDGVFRDECGRQIRSMESYAIPTLIRLQHARGAHLGKQRRYASYQLDRMDRARPMKAISTAPDDRVRGEIIHAYGETRAADAVEAILSQVDSSSHLVRKEARWAWLRYVTGREPPPAPKRKRKLPGGKEEEEEKPDYLTYREIATLALQKKLQEIKNVMPDAKATAKQMTDELFAYYDQNHAAEWDGRFAAAQQKEQAGDLKAATDEYGWILAHDPNYARRGDMAAAFAHYGDALRGANETARALGFYRQAIDLAPEGRMAQYAAARVAYLDGVESLARGHADLATLRQAIALDPTLFEARRALSHAERTRLLQVALRLAVALGALVLFGIGLRLLWRNAARPTG